MKRVIHLPLLLACLAAAGCGDSDVQEVRQWMAQVEKQARVHVPPLSEPKKFVPFAYGAKDVLDPFSPNKMLTEEARAAKAQGNKFTPDMARRKEALEAYPLDTMKMVGTMEKAKVQYALLQIDRAVYQVRAGQRVGQNFGLITAVSEDSVAIKEVVQDAAGEWVERMAKLELQESKGNKK